MAECKESSSNNISTLKQLRAVGHNDSSEENKTDKVMDPILIEDMKNSRIPLSFSMVQGPFLQNGMSLNIIDELVLLMHIMMIESGFIPQEYEESFEDVSSDFNYMRLLQLCDKIPQTWKINSNLYKLSYVIPSCTKHMCVLISTTCADDLLVNCSVSSVTGANYSLLIDPSMYLMKSTSNIENKYQNMLHLSCTFKTTISNRAKVTILRENNIKAPCLQDMPPEIIANIVKYFAPNTLAMFEGTCKYFRKISHDPVIWKTITGTKFDSFQQYKTIQNSDARLQAAIHKIHARRNW